MSLFRDAFGNQYNSDIDDVRQNFLGQYVYSPPAMGGDSNVATIDVYPVDMPSVDITKPTTASPALPMWNGKVVGHWEWQFVGFDDADANQNGWKWVEVDTDPEFIAYMNAQRAANHGFGLSSIIPSVLGALTFIGGGVTVATAIGNVETGNPISDHLQESLGIDAAVASVVGVNALVTANQVAADTAVANAGAVSNPPIIDNPFLGVAPNAPESVVASGAYTAPEVAITQPAAIIESVPTGLAPVATEATTTGEIVSSIGSEVVGGVKTVGAVAGGVATIERVINPPKPPVAVPPHPAADVIPSSQPSAAPQVGGVDLVLLALFAKVIL